MMSLSRKAKTSSEGICFLNIYALSNFSSLRREQCDVCFAYLLSSGELLQGGDACIDSCGHCCIFIPLSHSGMKNFGMGNEKFHRIKFQFSGSTDMLD
jgi:hypothetical protein